MSESIWEELARSPLDPDPNEPPSRLDWAVPIFIAAVAGLLLGVFAFGSKDTGATATTIAAETTTTTSTEPPEPDPEVPTGYVDIDGVGLSTVVTYTRDDNLYIVVNEATRSDYNPVEMDAFHASDWVLVGDGIELTAARYIESTLAPGVKTIEFAGVTALPVSAPSLIVRQASPMVVRTGCHGCGAQSTDQASGEVALDGLDRPYSNSEPLLIDVGTGITLVIDHLEFTDEWGYVEWHVVDENQARIRADIRIVFVGTDDPSFDGENPTQLVPENLFGSSQQNPATANPQAFTRAGSLVLDRVGEVVSQANTPTGLLLTWSIEWQHPVGEPITLPLTDIADLGSVD